MLYRVWYGACLGCYCTHDTCHIGIQTDYLLVFNWAVLHALFTVTSCEISTLMWRGILRRQSRTTGELSLFRSMELCSNNRRLPCVEQRCNTRREIATSWDVTCFAYGGESQLLQPHYSCFVFSRSLTCMANLFWLCLCKYKPLQVQLHLSMTYFSEIHINLIELNRNFYICMHNRISGLTESTWELILYMVLMTI